jgi:hypothetical protein
VLSLRLLSDFCVIKNYETNVLFPFFPTKKVLKWKPNSPQPAVKDAK